MPVSLHIFVPLALLTAASASTAQPRPAAPPASEAFATAFDSYIGRLRATPAAPPGTVVVVTHGARTLFARAYGSRNLATGAPMTLDTPVYNASLTKTYTGLLAAMLDAEGTLPLAASLADVWPNLRLPGGTDPRRVSAAQLLSHSAPINVEGLAYRSVYSGEGISAADVPLHIAAHGIAREAVFEYSNSGPFTWSAMMEARTGIAWRDMLQRRILEPLRMRRTATRAEDVPAGEIALCHPRSAGAWRPSPPKPAILMSAAGGMFASGRDTARFIQLFATDGASERNAIPRAVLRRTWARQSVQDRTVLGMKRDGYGLGWDLGSYEGHRFVARSGGYAGCRAVAFFLPESGFGIVVLTNGDVAANAHNIAIFSAAVDLWTGKAGVEERNRRRIADYQDVAAREVARVDAGDARLARVRPLDAIVWRSAAGLYVNDRLGTIQVRLDRAELKLRLGVSSGRLMWIGGDEFLAVVDPDPGPEALRFERGPNGNITALIVDDDRFSRRPG
jgi:CubicO group peptidase (beta-lactamase class C family)